VVPKVSDALELHIQVLLTIQNLLENLIELHFISWTQVQMKRPTSELTLK
jgi:hypothetical protein